MSKTHISATTLVVLGLLLLLPGLALSAAIQSPWLALAWVVGVAFGLRAWMAKRPAN